MAFSSVSAAEESNSASTSPRRAAGSQFSASSATSLAVNHTVT